jgi:histidinol-phosphatase (PHP family)
MLCGGKIMFDSHVHSTFSTDSPMTIEEILQKSRELNVGIILTEHMDLNFPDSKKFRFNCEDYFKQYTPIKDNKLLLGIEIGMHKDFYKNNAFIAQNYQFDYLLGSIHFIRNDDIYAIETYEGKSKKDVYELYFKEMAENLLLHDYIDCLGHIDYICRYSTYDDKSIAYDEFRENIDEVLKVMIDKEISLEINTRRFDDKQAINELIPVYKRYAELGGKYVVLGSDSHSPSSIAYNFGSAKELSDHCGLRTVYYKGRELQYNL